MPDDSKAAKAYSQEAKKLADAKRFPEAEELYRKAMAAAPDTGQYAAALGQFLLWNTKKFEESIECLDRAVSLGYVREAVYRQKGLALHRLGRDAEAETILKEGIQRIEAKLPELAGKARTGLETDLGIATGFLSIVLNELDRHAESIQLLERVKSAYPQIRDSNMGRMGFPAGVTMGHMCFGRGAYDDALKYFQLAYELAKWDSGTFKRSLNSEIPLEMELVRRRQSLGELKPDYIYRIAVVLVARTDVDFTSLDGTRVQGKRELSARHRDRAKWIALSFARHWEAMSNGRIQVEVDFLEADAAVTGFHRSWSKSLYTKKTEGRSLDLTAFNPSLEKLFSANYAKYDTIALIWNGENGIATTSNGGGRSFPIGTGQTIRRGFIHISSSQLGFVMFLHEMSHNMEAALGQNLTIDAGTSVSDDRRTARKRAFPSCNAYSEIAFNDCHLQKTIPKIFANTEQYPQVPPFANMNFRLRYPAPETSVEGPLSIPADSH